MEEEKDQLIKRVERLKKRVRKELALLDFGPKSQRLGKV